MEALKEAYYAQGIVSGSFLLQFEAPPSRRFSAARSSMTGDRERVVLAAFVTGVPLIRLALEGTAAKGSDPRRPVVPLPARVCLPLVSLPLAFRNTVEVTSLPLSGEAALAVNVSFGSALAATSFVHDVFLPNVFQGSYVGIVSGPVSRIGVSLHTGPRSHLAVGVYCVFDLEPLHWDHQDRAAEHHVVGDPA